MVERLDFFSAEITMDPRLAQVLTAIASWQKQMSDGLQATNANLAVPMAASDRRQETFLRARPKKVDRSIGMTPNASSCADHSAESNPSGTSGVRDSWAQSRREESEFMM